MELGLEEEELTVMKVKLIGKKDGESKTIEWNLLDFYDHETKFLQWHVQPGILVRLL
jgi:hypothetical protein